MTSTKETSRTEARADTLQHRLTSLPAAAITLVVLLLVAAFQNTELLNTDGIAYMRLAGYWAHGPRNLAASGYWGPMLSWLMVPSLWCGASPEVAARLAMAFAGGLFWGATIVLAVVAGLRTQQVRFAAWLAIPGAVVWSIENIVPDLLVAGWIVLAVAAQWATPWAQKARYAALCGAFWAAAYLSKAVALPLAVLTTTALALLILVSQPGRRSAIMRAWTITLLTLVAGCLPWIATLSTHYGRITFSTSARIAHAVVGPPDQERSHPFGRTFHQPEPGRLTSWEDPTNMPYAFWSPWQSRAYFMHQCQLAWQNTQTILFLLASFGVAGASLVGFLGAVFPIRGFAHRWRVERWRWGALVVLALALLYVPVYVKRVDQRYFQPAWPFLFLMGWGLFNSWPANHGRVLLAIWLAACTLPILPAFAGALTGRTDPPSLLAHDLAARIRQAQLRGPLAGNGLVAGGRVGLLTAYLLHERWLGEGAQADPDQTATCGARTIILRRQQALATALARDARFRNLDTILFKQGEDHVTYPLQVFEITPTP